MPEPRKATGGSGSATGSSGGSAIAGSRRGEARPALSTIGGSGGATPAEAAAGAVFAALADPTRRHLLAALAERGGGTATGLAAELPISRQAVAKHLATLDRAGLVSQRRDGRESRFELDPRPLTDAATWLATVGAEWDTRLSELKRLVDR